MMQEQIGRIRKRAIERGLDSGDPRGQILKLGEEYGELCAGFAKNNMDEVEDAIGDMVVVLTNLSTQLDLNIEDCVKRAMDEIQNRKGKMVNGVFVKEADLE
ncbi:MazG-like family protein [Sporosarcina sp. SAFN-010]|uniref:MazG-like family protein n=1 Tax=Sporosarcina sp. SAFN-010 TaxID=3387273 RepID=UPI003F80E03A